MDVVWNELRTQDVLALLWFLLAWLGYGPFLRALTWPRSISVRMQDVRRGWMHSMLGRDNRIMDASLLGSGMNSATFFASTTMVSLAAMLGMLAQVDQTYAAITNLSFTDKTSRTVVEFKIMLLALVFAHSFLKLTWALRQLNYCVALMGAAPLKPDAALRDRISERSSVVLTLAVSSFNAGIRGYYFALAALAWLLGPAAFATVTVGMVIMLLWRQFGSATAEAIRLSHGAYGYPAADPPARGPGGGGVGGVGHRRSLDPFGPTAPSLRCDRHLPPSRGQPG